jgi:hypothetical protein
MYIKKNVFENIFNTVTDVKGKTRDNIKTRKSIPLFFHCKNKKLIYDGSRVTKSKVIFSLDNNAQLLVYQWLKSLYLPYRYASNISKWLKSLYLPYRYASNISKLVNLMDDRFNKIKNHDCHMVMQTPIPLVY